MGQNAPFSVHKRDIAQTRSSIDESRVVRDQASVAPKRNNIDCILASGAREDRVLSHTAVLFEHDVFGAGYGSRSASLFSRAIRGRQGQFSTTAHTNAVGDPTPALSHPHHTKDGQEAPRSHEGRSRALPSRAPADTPMAQTRGPFPQISHRSARAIFRL